MPVGVEHNRADKLLKDRFAVREALIAIMLKNLRAEVQTRPRPDPVLLAANIK